MIFILTYQSKPFYKEFRTGVENTDRMEAWAAKRVSETENLCGFIFKSDSLDPWPRGFSYQEQTDVYGAQLKVSSADGLPRGAFRKIIS